MGESQEFGLAADRLDELADTADLMGDDDNANRLRERANELRLKAMALIPPANPGSTQ